MSEHPIDGLINNMMENLKKMVDANTVIGEAIILPNGVCIIPVTKLSCGFASGGTEFVMKEEKPFGGGTGGGISLQPLGFICVTAEGDSVDFIAMDGTSTVSNGIEALIDGVTSIYQNFKARKQANVEMDAEDVIDEIIEEQ